MMIMKLTFMSTWVCMQACMGIHIKRGIIVSSTPVKEIIWTLNEYDDDDDYEIIEIRSIAISIVIDLFYSDLNSDQYILSHTVTI